METERSGRRNYVFLLTWIVLPPLLLFLLHGNFCISIIFYLVLPSIYLSYKNPRIIPRALVTSIAVLPPMIILDYIAFFNKTWWVPTIFPFRFFDYIPIEDFFFTFWAVYVVIAACNHFFPKIYRGKLRPLRLIKSSLAIVGLYVVFLILYGVHSRWFSIPYYDAWLLAAGFVLPTCILFVRYPSLRKTFVLMMLYELIVFLPYEITAGWLGFWTFPSNDYLGMVHLLGWHFPIEEFLQWMVFFTPAVLAFSEFLTGDSLASDSEK